MIKKFVKFLLSYVISKTLKIKGIGVGKNLNVVSLPLVRLASGSKIIFGNNCTIHNESRRNIAGISHRTIIATISPVARISIGNRVGISGATIVSQSCIIIGDDVKIGANVKIYDTDFHSIRAADRMAQVDIGVRSKRVVIGARSWIGANALILKGVTIGEESVVAAGSVVVKNIGAGEIHGGNPAKFIKYVQDRP